MVSAGGVAMEWWDKIVAPVQRICKLVTKRLKIRKTGLVKLRHDVRTCEYEDVHVLWDMLHKNGAEFAPAGAKKRHFWNLCGWARSAQLSHSL